MKSLVAHAIAHAQRLIAFVQRKIAIQKDWLKDISKLQSQVKAFYSQYTTISFCPSLRKSMTFLELAIVCSDQSRLFNCCFKAHSPLNLNLIFSILKFKISSLMNLIFSLFQTCYSRQKNPVQTRKKIQFIKLGGPERIYNSHYGNGVPAKFISQCCPASQLKGKHCQKAYCRNGVVDTFGP